MEYSGHSVSIAEVDVITLFGRNDCHLASLERTCGVSLVARGDCVQVSGPEASATRAGRVLEGVVSRMRRDPGLTEEDVRTMLERGIRSARSSEEAQSGPPSRQPAPAQTDATPSEDDLLVRTYRATVRARSVGQDAYLHAIQDHDIVFSIGPAGTGKTYLAVAAAVAALRRKEVTRIVLARPAVEAGESLGFLPGALEDKVDPYLRPLYDALHDLLEPERLGRFQGMKIVEVAPLAFMRGRTLNDAFIILDEAQNTTPAQMKMFLTRLGMRSKAVVTGDITQIDLPKAQPSGLVEVQSILDGVPGVSFVRLTDQDVVRNPLVQDIVVAYEHHDQRRREATGPDLAAGDGANSGGVDR